MSHQSYPLQWPAGQPRHKPHQRKNARFDLSLARARDHLLDELRLLGARYVVISTDVPTRKDGLPRSGARMPDDPGVAVYFDFNGAQHVFACDKWTTVRDNTRAIGKTIEAIRGMGRWGVSEMLKRAVSGFKALPATGEDWRAVLGFEDSFAKNGKAGPTSLGVVKLRYRERIAANHPDRPGGDPHAASRINAAWEAAKKELG